MNDDQPTTEQQSLARKRAERASPYTMLYVTLTGVAIGGVAVIIYLSYDWFTLGLR